MQRLTNSLLLTLAMTGTLAAQLSSAQSKSSTPAFTLIISTGNQVVKAGAELKINVKLNNTGQRTFVSSKWVGGPDYSFKIDVRDAGGRTVPFSEKHRRMLQGKVPSGSSQHYYVGPGETFQQHRVVNDQYDLSAPGTYNIQVHRFDEASGVDVKSNTLAITITP